MDVLRNKYAEFNGRARRAEYWYFTLFNFLILMGLAFVGMMLNMPRIGGLYYLAVLVPGIAVALRRLHDVGKSGWYLLLIFVPLIGAIWLIVLFCTEGTRGMNEYGPDPKAGLAGGGMGNAPDFGAGSGTGFSSSSTLGSGSASGSTSGSASGATSSSVPGASAPPDFGAGSGPDFGANR